MAVYYKDKKVDQSSMIGCIIAYAGQKIPAGWLPCKGQILQSKKADGTPTVYDALYNVIGNAYGTGSEIGSFKLPDLTRRFLEGANGNLNIKVEDGLVNHTHGFTGTSTNSGQRSGHYHTKGTWRITGDTKSGNLGMHRAGASGALKSVAAGSGYKSVDGDGGYYGAIEMDTDQGGWTGSTSDPGTHRHTVTAAGTISTITGSMYNLTSIVQPNALCLQYIIKYK